MDNAAPKLNDQLPLTQPWTDETPLDQIQAEHRLRVADEREKAAAEKVGVDKAAADKAVPAPKKASGAGAKTKGRVAPKPAGKAIGARKKASKAEPTVKVVNDAERVTVVLQTSRFRGRDGRAIARRTPVLVTVDRGLQLIMQGYARETTDADKPAVAYLD